MICHIGNVEWQDSSKTRCLVMWRSPQEWGKLIYQWVGCNIFSIILQYYRLVIKDLVAVYVHCTRYIQETMLLNRSSLTWSLGW